MRALAASAPRSVSRPGQSLAPRHPAGVCVAVRALASSIDTPKLIAEMARKKRTPVSVKQLVHFGSTQENGFHSCCFLRNELPVRLAHMLKEFDAIQPRALLETRQAKEVREWYTQSFEDLMRFPEVAAMREAPNKAKVVEDFTLLTDKILDRHIGVVQHLAAGVLQVKRESSIKDNEQLHKFLDRFYGSRIGIRLLMTQHVETFGSDAIKEKGWVGVIQTQCQPAVIARDAAEAAQMLCEQTLLKAPNFEIVTPKSADPAAISFPYIPSHLYHIFYELLKNSFRAVTETHGDKPPSKMPVVRVVIVEEDLTIKIQDEGGGIARSGMPYIFTYLYTTAPNPVNPANPHGMNSAPLAGFGYGLPLSRLYARYLGGDLNIISIEGFGTDAFVYLRRAHAEEQLPASTH